MNHSALDFHSEALLLLPVSREHNCKMTHTGPAKQQGRRALTSMVLSLKYLMYSGPMYRGGLHVIRNTKQKKDVEGNTQGLREGIYFQTNSKISRTKEHTLWTYTNHRHIPFLLVSVDSYRLSHTYNYLGTSYGRKGWRNWLGVRVWSPQASLVAPYLCRV